MAPLIIPADLDIRVRQLFDSDNEVGLWLLAEQHGEQTVPREYRLYQDGEDSVDARLVAGCPKEFLDAVKGDPSRYELIPGHMHSRRDGSLIQVYDPYWTIPHETPGCQPGTIVEGEFFVHPQPRRKGDSGAFQGGANYFKDVHEIAIRRHLFVHPQYGSEGHGMASELLDYTVYELDPTSRFGVRRGELTITQR